MFLLNYWTASVLQSDKADEKQGCAKLQCMQVNFLIALFDKTKALDFYLDTRANHVFWSICCRRLKTNRTID